MLLLLLLLLSIAFNGIYWKITFVENINIRSEYRNRLFVSFSVQLAHVVPDSGPFHSNPHSIFAPPRPLTPGKWLWWKATQNPSSIYTPLSHRMFKFYMCNLFPSCYFFPVLLPFFVILCFRLQPGRDEYRDQIPRCSRCVDWNHL